MRATTLLKTGLETGLKTGPKLGWLKRAGIAGALLAGVVLAHAAEPQPLTTSPTPISAADAIAQSKTMFDKMKGIAKHVSALLAEATRRKDVVRIDCLRDKERQLAGHQAVAKNIQDALNSAPNDDERVQQFRRLSIVHEKVTTVGTEAEACVGEDVSYVGVTTVNVDIDPSVPTTDPTVTPLPVLDTNRPPEATPFV